jgi:hypothetical protein
MSDNCQALTPKQRILESLSRLSEYAGYDDAIERIEVQILAIRHGARRFPDLP